MATDKVIFCDTNILLDIFDQDRPCHGDAIALLWYHANNPETTTLMSPITSFKDAYYVLTRLYRDESQARDSIERIMGAYIKPVDMLASYGQQALDSNEPDFEDALVGVCAMHENAFALITRDKSAFKHFDIPTFSASEFLEREGFTYEEIPLL